MLEVLLERHLIRDSLLVLVQAAAVALTAAQVELHILDMLSSLKADLVDLGVQLLAVLVVVNMTMVLQMLVKAALVVTYNRLAHQVKVVVQDLVVVLLQVVRQVVQEPLMVKRVRLRQETLVKYHKYNLKRKQWQIILH